MTTPTTKSANPGVHTGTGIEFQKHCALHIFIENYHDLQGKKYFICLEHHDDFLFCFKTAADIISSIDSYQAKKSSQKWGMSELYEILKKITLSGVDLKKDGITKATDYFHRLHFISNHEISLKAGEKPNVVTCNVNESNQEVRYASLDDKIKEKIKGEVKKLLGTDVVPLDELDNIALVYIDLGKTSKAQKDLLVGAFGRVFGATVNDHRAAVGTLLELFRDAENTLNQGNVSKLLDPSKRVESTAIDRTIRIITSQTKAYDLWREEKKTISTKLKIPVLDQQQFSLDFVNSFDQFKDLTQTEHQKILKFTQSNRAILTQHVLETDCIDALYQKFKSEQSTQLTEPQLKATLFAAYIETRG